MTSLYIDAETLSQKLEISIREARRIIKIVQKETEEKNIYIPRSKRLIAPTERVMERIGVKL